MATSPPQAKGKSAEKRASPSAAPLSVHRDKEEKPRKARATPIGGQADPETFTLATRDKKKWHGDKSPPCFRVDGYRVRLDFYDEAGVRRRPYCCYLTAKEGEKLRGKYFEDAAPTILKRVRERRPKNDDEREKIATLIRILEKLS